MADIAKVLGMSQARAMHFLGPQSAGSKGEMPPFFGPDDESWDYHDEFEGKTQADRGPHIPVSVQTTSFRVQGRSLQNRPSWVDDRRGPSEMAGEAKQPPAQNLDRTR